MSSEHQAVTNFREYLRIKTVHPEPDYASAIAFLRVLVGEIGLPFKTIEVCPGREIVVVTWEGQNPSLPSIMLNSHTDVVPVYPEEWKVEPFSAYKFENGDIYGRGSQDMKSVGIQYLEAVRKMKQKGVQLMRTIHITFVPDEEIGGESGMQAFVKHEEFKKMNVGFALDEGLANPTDKFTVFYGERCPWWVRVTCNGSPGHGSRFIENTAAEKLMFSIFGRVKISTYQRRIINSFLDFRGEQEKKLKTTGCLKLGDVTTVNMTMLEGGIQCNVVPNKLSVSFDIRIPPSEDLEKFEAQIQRWCKEAGEKVTYEFIIKETDQTLTKPDESNIWWKAFTAACTDMGMQYETEIFPASCDIRYLREIGIPAFGFSPMNNTPILLHDHNEFLNENVFLRGIDYYCGIIHKLANVA